MKIELFYAPGTCAMAPFINLVEAGANFEVHAMNYRTNDHMSPEYLKINPKHKVPLLMVDGECLTETPAIHIWMARTFPDAGLMPTDAWGQAQAVSLLSWVSGGIHPYLSRINNPKKVCEIDGTAENVIELGSGYLEECFGIANEILDGKDYLMGDYTAPDAYFFWAVRRFTQFKMDLNRFPNVLEYFERMRMRPSVEKLMTFEKTTIEGFKSVA
ncbi:MAG: Glutathione S-transferase GST-6.0 [Alphaproteobacteria bacterium MarineAlpha11_Bin1]|nr:MAG: Glutathione S-transferase GST-6.0 [Alphaproteobacteria bacterium MarineAlpha11_Bin1]|tara:strand:- start:7167 stop:7811 length:645 start_codon:yes stop_codon:yes gene_type:complete